MVKTQIGQTLKQTTIKNPRYSKLLDVHRHSEHSDVSRLGKHIWSKCFGQPVDATPKSGGVKPKANSLSQFRVVILDLYMAWKEDPDLCVAVAMSNSAWRTGSRYNKIGLSRKVPQIIHRLHECGYIDYSAGSYSVPGAVTNRTSRIRAAEPLKQLFRDARFGPQHVLTFAGKECIIMRGSEKSERNLEYEDTPETVRMRADLTKYNRLLQRTFIDVPDQVQTYIERPVKKGPRAGEMTRVPVCGLDNFVHRVFNRNDWSCGGRFYGGWWQSVGSEFRKRIHINDVPTVEVDFDAVHVAIFAAKHGMSLDDDPYVLEEGLIEGLDAEQQRKVVKLLILMSLNAKDQRSACNAFRDASPTGSRAKSMKNNELVRVLDAFIERYPKLRDDLCADRGIYLMKKDSQIASLVIRHFTNRNIPVLCVHDSFLIGYAQAGYLKRAMKLACRVVIGQDIPMKNNYMGLDEVEKSSPDLADDYKALRYRHHCPAYVIRQRIFNERLAYLDSGGLG